MYPRSSPPLFLPRLVGEVALTASRVKLLERMGVAHASFSEHHVSHKKKMSGSSEISSWENDEFLFNNPSMFHEIIRVVFLGMYIFDWDLKGRPISHARIGDGACKRRLDIDPSS